MQLTKNYGVRCLDCKEVRYVEVVEPSCLCGSAQARKILWSLGWTETAGRSGGTSYLCPHCTKARKDAPIQL